MAERKDLYEQDSVAARQDGEPCHHVGAGRFCHVCRRDPRGPTATASTALGGAR